jgi:protein-S-isoprenylcysteine O-methyltransferase Ste14
MTELLAIMTLMFWSVIPLFWVPVHLATGFFRKLGLFSYLMPVITWVPIAYLIYHYRFFLLQFMVQLPALLNLIGIPLLLLGTLLHIWTAILLGGLGIIGVPEISSKVRSRLITKGPFSIVRHPTYLAHTLIFFGVFFITDGAVVGLVALLDFIVVNSMIIPLEEKELLNRFGEEFQIYKRQVPTRVFPLMHKK